MANGILAPEFFSDFIDNKGDDVSRNITVLKGYNADYVSMNIDTADKILGYYLRLFNSHTIYQRAYDFFNKPNQISLWILNSQSFTTLLEKFGRFVGNDLFNKTTELHHDHIRMQINELFGEQESVEFCTYIMVLQLRTIYPENTRISVQLPRSFYETGQLLQDKLACDVCYGSDSFTIDVYGVSAENQTLLSYNPILENLLQPSNDIPVFDEKDELILKIEEIIKINLASEGFSINDLADQLFVTPRTLQRKLAKLNTSFTKLRDDQRISVLNTKIEEGLTMQEIADVVGYSDVSSVYKILKAQNNISSV
ncbi:helix-turn-helix domain-containing protein [Neptuniibacter sp.]|uniref:helix-turn-helix domain-containing protein n=1 Tax=Neptuniibacter sp. TaxID=1962643 RepID=UPI002638278E|nr:helix-turn-helix domain-containing protein [Neptuniibacter sp.]MCP4596914.1 helix-turn-helix domain-containing protein [Neptuniibacter sp.]